MSWRGWKSWVCVIAVVMVAMAPSAQAGPYEDALAAQERGDHGPMYRIARKLAERGEALAQYYVGISFETGKGVIQDFAEALRWYRKAAEQGHVDAKFNIGNMYIHGEGVPRDYLEAYRWFRKAAERGHAGAQNNLGIMYQHGQGTVQDYAEAVRWYRSAAEKGDAKSQQGLGLMYANGLGITRNDATAAHWFRRAAEQGLADAQYQLARWYYFGTSVTRNYLEAVRWFRKAAEQDHVDAQFDLASLHYKGYAVTQDYAVAAKWFYKAAEQGNAASQFHLAYMYGNGLGVPLDYVEAHKWSSIAAANGETEAATYRDALEREHLTSPQFVEARRLARPWLTEEQIAALPPKQQVAIPQQRSELERVLISEYNIALMQTGLEVLEYDPGPVDGVIGPKTRAAIRAFQAEHGLQVSGSISEELVIAVRQALENYLVEAQAEQEEGPPELYGTGTGFVVSGERHVLTNDHVVSECAEVRIAPALAATVVARDEASDLALLEISAEEVGAIATFRQGRGIRPGDDIVVVGYPLRSYLATEMHVTTGSVSALAGPGDDRRFFQMTAPVQPGNSGGPVLDSSGNVVGVVMAKLDAIKVARATGDIPQNVNFAVGAGTARAFLDTHDVPYGTAPSTNELKPADVAAKARRFTVVIECWN